jgi:hypothetical protein
LLRRGLHRHGHLVLGCHHCLLSSISLICRSRRPAARACVSTAVKVARRGSGRKTSVISLICSWSSSSMPVARLVVRLRQVRVAGVARTVLVCFGPGAIPSPGVQASSGIDCRREPQRSAIASQLATPTRCPIVFRPLHGLQAFPSLCSVRAEGRGSRARSPD